MKAPGRSPATVDPGLRAAGFSNPATRFLNAARGINIFYRIAQPTEYRVFILPYNIVDDFCTIFIRRRNLYYVRIWYTLSECTLYY